MASVQAFVFDLDGTLLDTLADIANAANDVLESLSETPIAHEEYRTLVGDGVATLFHRLLPRTVEDRELHAKCLHAFEQCYEQRYLENSRPYAGIAELLSKINAIGIPMAILSNKPDDFTKRLAQQLLGEWRFDCILGASERFPKKPDPASTRYLLSAMQVAAPRTAYVGDTNTDMYTAKRAGCLAFGVTWGFRSRTELINSGADAIIESPLQILQILHL